MFGQNPQVGISNLPIDPRVLQNLATEMDVSSSLGLPTDLPLEVARMLNTHNASQESFHSEGFMSDLTENLSIVLKQKATVKKL